MYIEKLTVRGYEAGIDGRVKIQALCNYMEEAAGNHASQLGCGIETLRDQGLTWVLARARMVLHGTPPYPGERIAVHTWPVGTERLLFRRDYRLHSAGGACILSGVSNWVLMNSTTRKLEKMPAWAASLTTPEAGTALEDGEIRLPVLANGIPGPEFTVRLADIDQNGHVNNVRYIEFGLEGAVRYQQEQGGSAGAGTLCALDIIFRAEALFGDSIVCATGPDPTKRIRYSIRYAEKAPGKNWPE